MSDTDTPGAVISRACVQILREYSGRGPTEAKTTISDGTVVVALSGAMTTLERNLVRLGGAEQVRDFRDGLQMAMRDDLIAAVELVVGRRVLALLSDTELDADLTIQVFKLAPAESDATQSGNRFDAGLGR